jgi:biopolymer transport protein ExbD
MRIRNKPRASGEITDASMSDIAFLLLIFFLVTTTFQVQKGISYRLPKKPDERTEEVVVDETNRLVMTIKQWGPQEFVALVDAAPPEGPIERARAGEDVSIRDAELQEGIRTLAANRMEPLDATHSRLLDNLLAAKSLPSGTYTDLRSAVSAENLTMQVREGLLRREMGAQVPMDDDPLVAGDQQVAIGDTLVLADNVQGVIATAVRESELVVILKFFDTCSYDGMVQTLDMLRMNGVSRTGITRQQQLGGGA